MAKKSEEDRKEKEDESSKGDDQNPSSAAEGYQMKVEEEGAKDGDDSKVEEENQHDGAPDSESPSDTGSDSDGTSVRIDLRLDSSFILNKILL